MNRKCLYSEGYQRKLEKNIWCCVTLDSFPLKVTQYACPNIQRQMQGVLDKKMSFQKRMVKKVWRRYKIKHVGMRHVSGGRREIPLIGARENKSFILLPLKISPFVAIFRGKQPDMFLFKCQRNYSDISVFV